MFRSWVGRSGFRRLGWLIWSRVATGHWTLDFGHWTSTEHCFSAASDSLEFLLRSLDRYHHLIQTAARNESFQVFQRRDFEFLVQSRGGLRPNAGKLQQIQHRCRSFGSQSFPHIEGPALQELDDLSGDRFADARNILQPGLAFVAAISAIRTGQVSIASAALR